MRISDWSSDVCSSDLLADDVIAQFHALIADEHGWTSNQFPDLMLTFAAEGAVEGVFRIPAAQLRHTSLPFGRNTRNARPIGCHPRPAGSNAAIRLSAKMSGRSEEHTSELQPLMRISSAVFCLNKKKTKQ